MKYVRKILFLFIALIICGCKTSQIKERIVINSNSDNNWEYFELENEIEKLNIKIQHAASELDDFARLISENRIKAVPVLSEKLIVILEQLGMPNVRFNMEIIPASNYLPNGKDELQF